MTNLKFDLKKARLFRGLKQEDIAEKIGVHVNTYQKWERNPKKIPIGAASAISELLEMPLSIFLNNSLQNVDITNESSEIPL